MVPSHPFQAKPETHRNPATRIPSVYFATESTVWLIASTVPHVLPRLSRYTSGNKHQMATSQALASLAQDLESFKKKKNLKKNYPYCTVRSGFIMFIFIPFVSLHVTVFHDVFFLFSSLSPGSPGISDDFRFQGLINGLVVLIKCIALHLTIAMRRSRLKSSQVSWVFWLWSLCLHVYHSRNVPKYVLSLILMVFKAKHLKILKPLVSGARFPYFPIQGIQDTLHFMFKCDRSAATPSAGTMASVKSCRSCNQKFEGKTNDMSNIPWSLRLQHTRKARKPWNLHSGIQFGAVFGSLDDWDRDVWVHSHQHAQRLTNATRAANDANLQNVPQRVAVRDPWPYLTWPTEEKPCKIP